jgi:hypothetical protein
MEQRKVVTLQEAAPGVEEKYLVDIDFAVHMPNWTNKGIVRVL